MDKTEIADKLKHLIEEDTQEPIASHDQELDLDSYTMMLAITFVVFIPLVAPTVWQQRKREATR